MFYFKDAAVKASEIDTAQLSKVREFKSEISEYALYYEFEDVSQFEKLVRTHLIAHVSSWASAGGEILQPAGAEVPQNENEKNNVSIIDVEFGLFELEEFVKENINELSKVIKRINTAVSELGERLNERTAQIKETPKNLKGEVDRKVAKRIINSGASDLRSYTAKISSEIPQYKIYFERAMGFFERILIIGLDDNIDFGGDVAINELHSVVGGARDSLVDTKSMMEKFRSSIDAFPRLTSEMNKEKQEARRVTEGLISEFKVSIDVLDNIMTSIDNLHFINSVNLDMN
jgi:prefoldin subunit 5